ncbi:Hsp70/Hsp90 co-chaperone [Lachnellula hyalina]|uniref:Hsp70/Hsp90 co-chaperone n=1 Tax=Lachnellula hyalina TaxID=1316788 RepID=A0A8H8QZJ2_9HELO|nr:Hsp70/Hsp90 co-chaperone [Lachnellula hyalina]TVY25351.1 Hsp70/Hsp90 co-chaperone [Lachnellula hyalina]
MEDAKIQLVPDPVDPTSTLSFPTVLLYPLHLESDFIKAFNETEPLGHHLSYILPLPWDKEGLYKPTSVECYMETISGGLIKVGRKVSLLKVLTSGNVEVVDEVVKIFVVPKAKAEDWVLDFKKKKAADKSSR